MCDYSTEQWRDVVGYEWHYQVSDMGRVRSFRSNPPRILKQNTSWQGYKRICLSKKNKTRNFSIHVLVLEAFVGPKPEGMQARHFPDRDKANNRLANLSWGTQEENSTDKVIHGTSLIGRKRPDMQGEKSCQAVLNDEKVLQARAMWKSGNYLQRELAAIFGMSKSGIQKILNGGSWKHLLEESA